MHTIGGVGMTAQYLTIEGKQRRMPAFLASLADFTVTPAEATGAEVVRADPNVSLYCFDDDAKQAIFVELPADIDLSRAPFVYQTQYDHARRLIAVPYESFRQLARDLPAVSRLIMIYMTGRSGSTVLSHVFNELDTVLSLSEPDAATQFVHLRAADGSRDEELRELLDCTVRFLFKPSAAGAPSACVLKVRSEGTRLMDLFQATFPQVKNLFLYRDALGWVASFYRIVTRGRQLPEYTPVGEFLGLFALLFKYDFTPLTAYLDEGTTELSIPQLLALWWMAIMEWYLAKYQQGFPVLAVRYDDLNAHREQVVAEIFKYCGLPATRARETLAVFERDAQAGTMVARDDPRQGNTLRLSDEQRAEVSRILARHPILKQSDFLAPGTLRV
ncbi:MAG TPA: sulfotransferase domain-containing protein [Ardenticatenaceae bacterium]|nr:sulfotransferase domain-containing protein [Ardenticatenaceae bacterium]